MARYTRFAPAIALAIVTAVAIGSCSSDEGSGGLAVDGAAAITALIDWVVDELPPVLDDDGELVLPVVYVTSQSGDTMDAGLQASVVEATAAVATVRFADDRSEAIDDTSGDAAVRDDGVMLVVGDMPAPGRTLDLDVERYESLADVTMFTVEITAGQSGPTVKASPLD